MFKKLRNKFLFLNLIIITVLMTLSFSSIFLITYRNIQNDIKQELLRASEIRLRMDKNPDRIPQGMESDKMPPQSEQSVSFSILTDGNWNKMATLSYLDLDDAFYDAAKKEAQSIKTDAGSFKLEGNTWAFIKKPNPVGYSITFLNTTSRQAILVNLIYTFLTVAVVMFLFILIISKFFADRAIKPIKNAFEKQKQFIADSSHELKTPLSVIHTNVDVLLANKEKSVESQSKWLHYIKSETERMTKLTNDLLYLTKIDYSETDMIFAHFNLSETVINVILTMEAVVFENHIALDHDRITPQIMMNGNRDQLAQVVMILLDNAIKYTNPTGRIEIALERHHHRILLSVSNTGVGIPPEQIGRVFDRFYRTDESRSRKSGGYGLGLSIAKAITEQHGGAIHATSIANERTVFTVELLV